MVDPLAIAPLALSAWKLIEPYAKKLGGKLLEKAGETLPDVAGKVWDTVKEKMESNPATSETPADLVNEPENPNVQGMFQHQLEKLLKADQEFAKRLDELVKEAKTDSSRNATLNGDGALVQGDHSVGVGKGGVYVGGNVSGSTVITGDNNVVNEEKKRAKKK